MDVIDILGEQEEQGTGHEEIILETGSIEILRVLYQFFKGTWRFSIRSEQIDIKSGNIFNILEIRRLRNQNLFL
jgi:hypothetical protein